MNPVANSRPPRRRTRLALLLALAAGAATPLGLSDAVAQATPPIPTAAPRDDAAGVPAAAPETPPAPAAERPSAGSGGGSGGDAPALPVPADEAATAIAAAGGGAPAATVSPGDLALGAFQRGFYLTALKLAQPLANLGDPAAQVLLGEIHSRGLGVAVNLKEAARWYRAAARAGSPEGQFRYALLLIDGTAVPQDLAEARDLMKLAADSGLPLAEFNYAQMVIQSSPGGGFEEARSYFEKAAEAGVADAQYAMSQIFAYGRGPEGIDLAAARAWLRTAAANGHDTAQIEYGIWLVNGKGGPADLRQGFLWLRRAAERGNPIAINRVAHLYKDGIGTEPDVAQAAKWYVLARRVDNTDAILEDFFRGLDEPTRKAALEAANRFRAG